MNRLTVFASLALALVAIETQAHGGHRATKVDYTHVRETPFDRA